MNIESLISKIELFNDLVIKSGFKRDVNDYIQAIQQGQNQNLVFMKDLSNKVIANLTEFENFGLKNELTLVLKDTIAFTELNTLLDLEEINNNAEIQGNEYYSRFYQILIQINNHIEQNKNELDSALQVFLKYRSKDEYESEQEKALVSLIFKDLKSTGSIKEFARVLNRWNRMLLIYHTLLTSNSPKEIELVEIQNGSIDVIFNVDLNIALDLTVLIKTGLKVYGAYLLYKSKTAKLIIESYMGNEKLIEHEKQREKLMLDNIKESIAQKALEQYNEKLQIDSIIETTSIEMKIDEVSKVIADHIINGNELKLLTSPPKNDENESDISIELREETARVRETFKKLSNKDKLTLIEKYTINEIDENTNSIN